MQCGLHYKFFTDMEKHNVSCRFFIALCRTLDKESYIYQVMYSSAGCESQKAYPRARKHRVKEVNCMIDTVKKK